MEDFLQPGSRQAGQRLLPRTAVILGSRNEIERIAVYHASPNKAAA